MQKTFNQLVSLGYQIDSYLVGLNQFLSKEKIVIKHQSRPEEPFQEYFEEGSATLLPNGVTLFTKKPSLWYEDFSSDIIIEEGIKKRTWRVSGFSHSFQEWVVSNGNDKPEYSSYSMYYRNMDDATFAEFVDRLFRKVSSFLPDEELMPEFMSLIINTDFTSDKLMAEISLNHSKAQVEKFIEAVKQCNKLELPITDYREVFNYSQSN